MEIQYKGFIREKIRRNPVIIRPDASFFDAQDYIHVKGIRHLAWLIRTIDWLESLQTGIFEKQPLPMLLSSASKNLTIF